MANLGTILVVDDEPASLKLLTDLLTNHGYEVRPADSGELALESVRARAPELILLDLRMPGLSGFEVCRRLKAIPESRGIPVIFVSSSHESDEHVEGLRLGAVDFIVKPFRSEELLARMQTHLQLRRLQTQLEALVTERTRDLRAANEQLQRELSERRMIEEALRESEGRFRDAADTAPVIIWVSGPDGKLTFCNKRALTLTGRTMHQLAAGAWREVIHPDDLDGVLHEYSAAITSRQEYELEARFRRADGEYRWMLSTSVPRFIGDVYAGQIGTLSDITDVKRNQENMLATQKLESLGVLAAGIAHDFNNLLGSISAEADFALSETPGNSSVRESLDRIGGAAIRGSEVVSLMMDYAGGSGGNEAFESVDISSLVQEMLEFLKVTVSKKAVLQINLDKELPAIRANPAQIRRVVMNLVINASEALDGRGGVIQVSTSRTRVYEASRFVAGASLPEGDYVLLEVSDTGHGMTQQAQAQIFDPFYTTKSMGRGLGLSAVQGIVRSHGGAIRVTSEAGLGSTFQLFLPFGQVPDQVRRPSDSPIEVEQPATGNQTVLLIEDEDTLRLAVSKSLAKIGFSVLTAANGVEAVNLFRSRADDVGAILLDLTLPGLSGPEVFREVRRIKPHVKVVLTSAYDWDRAAAEFAIGTEHVSGFIRKPYRIGELAEKLRHALTQDDPHRKSGTSFEMK
ncbi:MAG: response regulator [Bryobacteraceae bacterium]